MSVSAWSAEPSLRTPRNRKVHRERLRLDPVPVVPGRRSPGRLRARAAAAGRPCSRAPRPCSRTMAANLSLQVQCVSSSQTYTPSGLELEHRAAGAPASCRDHVLVRDRLHPYVSSPRAGGPRASSDVARTARSSGPDASRRARQAGARARSRGSGRAGRPAPGRTRTWPAGAPSGGAGTPRGPCRARTSQVLVDLRRAATIELPVEVELDLLEHLFAVSRDNSPRSRTVSHNAFSSAFLPRCSRDITVPIGTSMISAISL